MENKILMESAIALLEENGYTVAPKKPWYVSLGVWGGSLAVLFIAIGQIDAYTATLESVPEWLESTRNFLHGAAFDFGKLIPFAALSSAGFGLYGRIRIGDLN
jgi:hypothetical protein